MEAKHQQQQVNQNDSGLPTKFVTKVMQIPVVKFGADQASGLYGRIKDINKLTHKSFELAETVTGKVVTPLAQKGICIASRPLRLHQIDDYATQGLQSLEEKVPIIQKEPRVMVSDVTGAVTQRFNATKERVSQVSENVLGSRPVQTYFDVMEFVLNTTNKTLNKVLPPVEGQPSDVETPNKEDMTANDRGWYLLKKFFFILNSTKDRVVMRVGRRIDKTSNAADAVFHEAKKAVTNALPPTSGSVPAIQNNDQDASNTTSNGAGGESGQGRSRKQKGKGNKDEN